MLPVSACIIAKNEEGYIEECLRHLRKYDMEIVVTDTGSSDRTREIALKYADKVLDFEWVNDFSAARNYCAQHASNNWILAIDCDEYVQSMDVSAMRICMQKYAKGVGNIVLHNAVYRENGEQGYSHEEVTRFYNRNFFEFAHAIHESLVSKQNIESVVSFSAPIEALHMGYLIDGEKMQAKQQRNMELLYAALENDSGRNAYTYFQIAQSEHVVHNYAAAIENYLKCLEAEQDMKLQYMQTCVTQLATAYAQLDEPQKAVDILEQYMEQIHSASFAYTYGLALLGVDEPLKALMQLVKASLAPDRDTLGESLVFCYQRIIQLYEMFGQPQLAEPFEQKYQECLRERKRILQQVTT